MSDTIKWSFSADRCMRRCQRQYFLQHVAAWHNARDPVRKESFLLKQVRTLEVWTGLLVHRGIELYVAPALQAHRPIDWQQAIVETSAMACRQFDFSKARRYREEKIIKGKAGDDYCALLGHETEEGIPPAELDRVLGTVERTFLNFSEMGDLLAEISEHDRYWPELEVRLAYDAARIEVRIDLLFFREYGKPTIVDWKVSESLGASDADLQTLYGWALCQHPSWAVTKAEDCELLEVQLLTKTVIRHRATQETFDRREDRIYRSVSTIKSLRGSEKYDLADLENYEFAENPNSCVFCSHRSLCRQLAANEAKKTATEPAPSLARKERSRYVAPHPQLF